MTILFLILFLVGAFFLSTTTHCLSRLGETLTLELIKEHPGRFFYYPVHQALFKKRHFELLVFASSIGENLARLGYAAFAILFLFSVQTLSLAIVLLIIFLLLILLFGDYLPRFLSLRSAEKALAFSLPISSFLLCLSLPFSALFLIFTGKEKDEERSDPLEEVRETVAEIVQASEVKGRLDFNDKKLLTSVLEFKDRIVREVMIPRVDLFYLPVTATIREAASQLIAEGYSRIPVYRESLDNIVGILMFKDILELYMECESGKKESSLLDTTVETIAKNVFYTPETKKVSHLLQEFRTKKMHMAIVVDEYGGTEGVVTIEDILEEIVGEIADEYDVGDESLFTVQPGSGSWIVDARMSIFDAEDTFGIHIPQEGDYDTIGGYIYHKAGAIPPKGYRLTHEEFDLEILSSSERSIEKVRVSPKYPKKVS